MPQDQGKVRGVPIVRMRHVRHEPDPVSHRCDGAREAREAVRVVGVAVQRIPLKRRVTHEREADPVHLQGADPHRFERPIERDGHVPDPQGRRIGVQRAVPGAHHEHLVTGRDQRFG